MQKYLLLSLLATILGLLPLHAQEFTQGDFTFRVLDPEARTVAVIGCTLPANSDVTIPATTTLDDTEYTVTRLDAFASDVFQHQSSLSIPASLTNISDGFFYSNPFDNELTVDPENEYFTIYEGALYSKDMTRLYTIPKNSTSLIVPEGVTSVEFGACSDSKLTTVTLPESIRRIEHLAFYISQFEHIDLPSELEYIGGSAFAGGRLKTIVIPANTLLDTEYADTPFSFCPMTEISVDPQNPYYNSFDGCLYSKDSETLIFCPSLKDSIIFPDCVKKIGNSAFMGCQQLKSISLPNTIQTLGFNVFNRSGLEEITLPESITVIPRSTFECCASLKKITIPETLIEIEDYAFLTCLNLGTVIIPSNVSKISATAFNNCSNAKILIPNSDITISSGNIQPNNVPQPTYYAENGTDLYWNLFELMGEYYPEAKVKPLPNAFEDMNFLIGPDSEFIGQNAYTLDPSNGFQADLTLPSGLSLTNFHTSYKTVSDFEKLENGDYRVICYSQDNSTLDKPISIQLFVKSDETLERGKIIFHNIIYSIDGVEYHVPNKEAGVSGYNVTLDAIPDTAEEDDIITLPNPLSKNYDDVTYIWSSPVSDSLIDNNSVIFNTSGAYYLTVWISDPNLTNGYSYLDKQITITPALWGDSNSSGSIELADVVTTVNHILERNPEPFNAKLADVDRNGRINIVDVTSTVKLVLEQPIPDTPESDIQGAPAARELAFSEISRLENGKNILSLNLKPNTDYTALQTDLEVPADVTIEAISIGEGLSRHTVDYATVAPGVTRVILYSPSLTELAAGEEQPVLNITLGELPANGTIRTLRTLACDAQGKSFTLGNAEKEFYTTTGITTTATAAYNVRAIAGGIEISGAEGAAITVSDLQGRTVATALGAATATRLSLTPGVYLVSATGQHPAKVLVK